MGADRCHVDEVPAALALHARQRRRDAVQHAADVDVERLVPLIDAQRTEGRQRHHARVVHEHVDASELGHRGLDEGFERPLVTNIQRLDHHRAVGRPQRGGQLLEPVDPACADDDPGAQPGQVPRCGLPYAAAGAADRNHLPIQMFHVDPQAAVLTAVSVGRLAGHRVARRPQRLAQSWAAVHAGHALARIGQTSRRARHSFAQRGSYSEVSFKPRSPR